MKKIKFLIVFTIAFAANISPVDAQSETKCSIEVSGNENCFFYSTANNNNFTMSYTTNYKIPVKNFLPGVNFPVKTYFWSANLACSPRGSNILDVRLKDTYGRNIYLASGTYKNMKFNLKSVAEIWTRAICKKFTNG